MDLLLSAALQEVAVEGTQGCTLHKLWVILQTAGIETEMITNKRSKQLLWQQLIRVPGMLLLLPNLIAVSITDPSIQSVDDAEKLGLHLVAPESLRESSLGMYDLRVCDARLSKEQRNVLECIAKSRGKGITQSQLAKEFKIPGNKMFYLVKMLEVRGLVVRQATLVRTVDGNSEGNRHVPIVATNLLHLTRYAKDLTLSSHQRFEIFSPPKDSARDGPNAFREDFDEEAEGPTSKEREFIIKDDLPAMQAVCQKLEETDGKVLVVSDLKTSLGYRMAVGHRTWRRLVKRLQDAGLVEILSAQIEHKVRACIRLVKSFDSKAFKTVNDETENDLPLKCAKRGQVTDLVTELPIDQQIYNLIDRSGLEGVQMIEVFNSLGLQNKRNYYRISTMLERHLLVSEAENHKRSTLYRLKTAKNVNNIAQPSIFDSYEEPKISPYEEPVLPSNSGLNDECEEIMPPENSVLNEGPVSQKRAKGSARRALQQARMLKGKSKQSELAQDEMEMARDQLEEIEMKLEPAWTDRNAIVPFGKPNLRNYAVQAESPLPMSFIPREFKDTDNHLISNTTMSTTRAQREKRILEKLQAEKFVLRVELHRWLEEVENRKNIMMDRKTLSRMLQGLQASGHCKCVMLSMPGLTNCGRQRTTEVVLLPSLVVDPELLSKVHDQVRKFDMLSRGHGVSRVKAKDSVPVLTGVPRMHTAHVKRITKFDTQSEHGRSMQANGFIPAKMVRVRMLHYFLWGYVNSLPDDLGLLPDGSGTSGEMVGSCKIFGLANSVQTMPLELFLQTIGSFHNIENVTEWCKQGLCLRDLPKEDMLTLLDSNATGRLSWLVDVLRRLKLVRLVMGCGPAAQLDQEDFGKSSLSAVLTYAMEREPYLEEPAPHPLPSMNLDTYDLSPRARHEFSIVNKDGLDAYWQNLEYFYSGAQPTVARHAFPGSNVPELFGLRSWASLKIMSVEQRTELLKRVGDGGIEKRKPWHECVLIAKELNLSLQQVLRVSYEKNRVYRLQTLQKAGQTLRKRNIASGDLGEPPHVKAYKKQRRQHSMGDKEVPSERLEQDMTVINEDKQAPQDEDDGDDDDDDDEGSGIGGQPMNNFSFAASTKPSRPRSRRFTWSEDLDRILIVAYARQRAQLGALFHRVDWDLMAGLPAPPRACRRRMAQLRLDLGVRKAVMSLCSLLGLRYLHHTQSQANTSAPVEEPSYVPGSEVAPVADNQIIASGCEGTLSERPLLTYNVGNSNGQQCVEEGLANTNSDQEYSWDDIREPFLAAALDEVIRCRAVVKANASTRGSASRSKLPKGPHPSSLAVYNSEGASIVDKASGSTSPVPADGKLTTNLEAVAAAGGSFSNTSVLSRLASNPHVQPVHSATICHDVSTQQISSPMPGRSLMAAGPTRRVRRHIQSTLRRSVGIQEVTNEQLVQNSVAVANAVELVKLVLLNSGEDAELSGTLVEAVQRFKETEIFTAVKYLRQRGFLIAGQAGQTFVLSPKFFHDCSASRFPIETGDECIASEEWFHEHLKEVEQDWVTLPSQPKSGQLSHLLALVSTNEFSLTPLLPANDLGEAEVKELGKRKQSTHEPRDYVRNVKARTVSPVVPHWSTLRRERGFPGIEVSMIRSSRSLAAALDASNIGSEAISEQPIVESRNFETQAKIDEVLDLTAATGVSQLDDDHDMSAMGEALIGTESVFTELNTLSYLPCGGHDWGSNSKDNEQNPSAASDTSSRAPSIGSRNSTLDDCILHWCTEASDNSAGARKLFHLTPELLQAAYCAVEQAGEEGLHFEKLVDYLQISGMDEKSDLEKVGGYVQALESFGLVKRVNAYDHVQIAESSRSARFYLHVYHKASHEAGQQSWSGEYLPDSDKQLVLYNQRFSTGTAAGCDGDGETNGRISRFNPHLAGNSSELASQILTGSSTTTSIIAAKGGDHRIIPLRPQRDVDEDTEYVAIVPWLAQNGTINKPMLKGLIRRVMGIVTLHPGISEDTLVDQINVLNPQASLEDITLEMQEILEMNFIRSLDILAAMSVRQLVQMLELDGHLLVRSLPGPVATAPPSLLQNLMARQVSQGNAKWTNHYFVNPLAGQHL